MKKDTFIYELHSDGRDSGTAGEATFNARFPNKRTDYTKLCLFVDNLVLDTDYLGNHVYCARLICFQPNSYNSINKGNNDVIATLISPNIATSRTIDIALTYQNPTAPIDLETFPSSFTITWTIGDNNTPLDYTTNDNIWGMRLRLEAYYGEGCGCN
jgi:hypothetical protein